MIDLHFHLLPGIDDGPPDYEETLRMARRAVREGTHTAAATPHLFWAQRVNRPDLVRKLTAGVREFLKEHDVPLRIVGGTEIPTLPQTLHMLEQGPLQTLGDSQTLLLEPPFTGVPDDMPDFIDRLLSAGYQLLLAHPERCRTLQEDPGRLRSFFPAHLPIQITSLSLTGEFGPRPQETALELLTCGNPLVLASDSHSSSHRPPGLGRAVEAAAAVVGAEYARQMATDLPQAILEDRPLWAPSF